MSTKTVEQYLESGKYLPDFMRDFHDQKDLFKTIHTRITPAPELNWVDAQIYVVDTFLYFMARRGYTLQKSRAKLDFRDIHDDIDESISKMNNQFASFFATKDDQNDN